MRVFFNSTNHAGLAFKASDSKLYAGQSVGGVMSFGATGVSVTTGVWYLIDIKVNAAANPWLTDVQVDGAACGQRSTAVASATPSGTVLGSGVISGTYDAFYDDVLISSAGAADYPIGAGTVEHFVATADGTHNIAGTGDFQRGNSGTDILNATTTAFQLVDDVPLPSGTVDEADNIRCVAPANPTTDYVECIFGPAPGISAPTVGPRMVDIVLAHHQIATQTGEIEVRLNDNGSLGDIYNPGVIAGVTTYRYARAGFADPPSAATTWNANNDGGNGDFRDLRFRVYGPDSAPDQCLDGIILEAEFAVAGPPSTVDINDTATASETRTQEGTNSQADTATASETVGASIPIDVADTATATDDSATVTGISAADTASASETQTLDATESQADTATASDALASATAIDSTDTATATDTESEISGVSTFDSASATESLEASTATSTADTATASESLSASTEQSVTDLATASDTPSAGTETNVVDTATATETLQNTTEAQSADSAAATETFTAEGAASSVDTSSATETQALAGSVSLVDLGTASDVPTDDNPAGPTASNQADTATANESLAFDVIMAQADVAVANETDEFLGFVDTPDIAISTEQFAGALILTVTDGATATDVPTDSSSVGPVAPIFLPTSINVGTGHHGLNVSTTTQSLSVSAQRHSLEVSTATQNLAVSTGHHDLDIEGE